jgi:two-component system, chemotaxis family, chemotaxis protein CheY
MCYKALVVDDSMLIRHTVCRVLEGRGYHVESATNGLEALEMLQTFEPHIIFTDLQMPKMDGYGFMAALKLAPRTATIPLVILAGRQSEEKPCEDCARWVIYKDIDIVGQLRRAVETILPASAEQTQ